MIVELQYLICFLIFVVLQSFFINGVHEITRGGMFFYQARLFLSKYISAYWMNPVCNCIKCMSSLWGTITFWATILPLFEFNFYLLWVWVSDMIILVVANYFIYKKV